MFKRFVAASGITNLADGVAVVAWAWLASLLTRDPLWISLVPVALRLPWFVCALPAGIITDRVDRRWLILCMDALRAVGFGLAAVAVWIALPLDVAVSHGVGQPGLFAFILASATLVGVAEVFRDNAAQTMLPALVSHEQLERANGRLWTVELLGNSLIGPALGAFMIAVYLPLPFFLNALAYVLAIALILPLRGEFQPQRNATNNWRAELREGFAFLKAAPLLRNLAVITGVWNLLFMMVSIGLVLHVQENLGLGARAYGLILAAGAVGGIAAGLIGEHVVRVLGQARAAQWMLAATPIAFFGAALAPSGIALAVVLAIFEFTGVIWNTVSVSYRQRSIPDRLLGRVNSIYRMLAWGMMPVGLLLSGMVVRLSEASLGRETALIVPFVVAGVGAVALVALSWRAIGRGFAKP